MGGFTIEEADTAAGKLKQAASWLRTTLKASRTSDANRIALKAAGGCVREALRRFEENRDAEWMLDALKRADYSASPEATRCVEKVRNLCRQIIDRDA